ncbi:MAG: M48 family metallopeptidase [Rickettsiales bacterium]
MIRFVAISSVALLLSACQAPTTHTHAVSQAELAAEQARQQKMVDEVQASGGRPKNWKSKPGMRKQFERVASRLEEPAAQLCRELGIHTQRDCYYHYSLSTKDVINAYADGNKVGVTVGMMRFVKNDHELAAVIAHEIAHNMMGHVDAAKQNTLAGGLFGYALDAIAASQGINTGGGFSDTGFQAGRLSYSQGFESEADYVGLYIMARGKYDIKQAPNLWRRMAIADPEGIYNSVSHPTTAERFIALQKTVSEIQYKKKHRIPLWPDFKQEVTN